MVIRPSRSHQNVRGGFSPPPSTSLYRNIAITFVGLTAVVVIGVLWITSVYARVNIKVKRDSTNVQTVIEIAKSPEEGQLQGAVVQGVFEKIQEFAVKETSAEDVPQDTVVQGTVKIINNYSKPQTLVKTTRLLTADGKLYRIDKTVTLNPKESIQVAAHSDKAGKEYVIPAGTRLTIPGLWIDLQKWIYAETVSGFSGGTQVSKIVSSVDVSEAQKALEDAVFEQAKKTLDAEAGSHEGWKAVYVKNVLDKKSNVSPGQKSDQFLASVKLDVTAVYYPEKDMDALIRQKLKDKLPEGRELIDYDSSLVVFKVDKADSKLEQAQISISAQASSQLTDKSPQLSKDSIVSLSLDEAKTKLLGVTGVESVDIRIRPSWINKLPGSKDKIELIVE
ncbi:MAG: hypothetical protein ABIB04_03435 [Patescibacteria group bacterium]